jgi:sialic acid synthase
MNTKLIAELCYNHLGKIDVAKQMIDKAKDCGFWAVKFQKWDYENFPDAIKKQPRNDKNSFGKTYYDHRKSLEFSIDELLQLKKYTEKKELEFICSGKDLTSIKLLIENGITNIKIPSQKLLNFEIFDFLQWQHEKLFIIVSTGMHSKDEIISSKYPTIAKVMMHCVSLYPARLDECNLGWMRQAGIYNGYSSHEIDGAAIKYAVLLGAEYIERHFTLDKTMKGSDQAISSDENDIKKIIAEINEVEKYMTDRKLTEKEIENRRYYGSF